MPGRIRKITILSVNHIGFLFIAIGIILKGTDGELMGIGGIIIILISLIPEKDIEEEI